MVLNQKAQNGKLRKYQTNKSVAIKNYTESSTNLIRPQNGQIAVIRTGQKFCAK